MFPQILKLDLDARFMDEDIHLIKKTTISH